MLPLNKYYRKTYTGENIVVERVYENGRWQDITEHVESAVINNQTSNQAVVLGNGPSRLEFDLRLIKKHRGGLLGSRRLQSYGCNALYRDFAPDFLIAVGTEEIVTEIANSGYTTDHIVYANSNYVTKYPDKFYIIPHDPYADAGTTAAYIAAFDGHKNIYMLGFDSQDTSGFNYNVYAGTYGYDSKTSTILDYKWKLNIRQLATVYDDVMFSFVYQNKNRPMPAEWRDLLNVRAISIMDFAIAADL